MDKMIKTKDKIDSRLVGTTAENIFLSLLNQRGIFAHSFDTAGFDGIAFDIDNQHFKLGQSPFYVQIKCRGSKGSKPNDQGHRVTTVDKIVSIAKDLRIPQTSLYFVVGFFKNNDIRNITFFTIPFSSLQQFKTAEGNYYRFSVSACKRAMEQDPNITVS